MDNINPFVHEVYGCDTCKDNGMVQKGFKAEPCPSCAHMTYLERKKLRAERRGALHRPTLRPEDLTEEELSLCEQWKQSVPNVNPRSLLTWIEGRRYDPRKDPDFLKKAREGFKAWRAR